MRDRNTCLATALLLVGSSLLCAQQRRKVIFDQDCAGPGGTDMQSLLVMVQSPNVDVLGVTVVSGDQWRDEEVMHALRLLEIAGRTDIPVVSGAAFPLVHTREEANLAQERYGKVNYMGAWDQRWWHEPFTVPKLAEGEPQTKAAGEDAAHFLVRMVHKYPHEVTIYEGGPMTNLALAIALDPQLPELAQGLVFMGGSLNPMSDEPEFANSPRHEFNIWFDPEAAYIVLRARWQKIVCTPVDISIKTKLSPEMIKKIEASGTGLAQYLARFYQPNYMWDELAAAAWLDPSLITKKVTHFMSVDIDHGAGYGNTLIWDESEKPKVSVQPVEIQLDLNTGKFYDMFVSLMTRPTSSH
ncbi:MAG TPA: nucleoside hydrolase [Bryobacteraceae bacterium]|jgi:inosine-uridine nucleoside N-ribohydrolase|nr:nucleoside hydrolase [Bryobacteraceae bacterium]